MKKQISEKRQKQIDDFLNTDFQVGEQVIVSAKALSKYDDRDRNCKIVSIDSDSITVEAMDYGPSKIITIEKSDILHRDIRDIGANPFYPEKGNVRHVAFTLESILFNLDILGNKHDHREKFAINDIIIEELNWNPFVYIDGEKTRYQRAFVWTENDNQLFIESIYAGASCGQILVRKRSYSEVEKLARTGETELAFHDIVDGKQRLNAIRKFIQGEYTDMHGNYFADLSAISQHKFTDHQLIAFAEMKDAKDDEVIYQFLRMNFTGVPQSQEHIDYVRSIMDKIS